MSDISIGFPVQLCIGPASINLKVKWDDSDTKALEEIQDVDVDIEIAKVLCSAIQTEVTPEMICDLLKMLRASALAESGPVVDNDRFYPIDVLDEITIPFKVVNAPTFLVSDVMESMTITFNVKAEDFPSIAQFNKAMEDEHVAIYSILLNDEEAKLRTDGVTDMEAMRKVLGRGPRVSFIIQYAKLSPEQLEAIHEDFLKETNDGEDNGE